MIIKLVEVKTSMNRVSLQEVYVNPEQVVCVRPSYKFDKVNENVLPEGLDKRQEFSTIHLSAGRDGLEITVVGNPKLIESKLLKSRRLLKG